jgi:hypothetical protein
MIDELVGEAENVSAPDLAARPHGVGTAPASQAVDARWITATISSASLVEGDCGVKGKPGPLSWR